MRVVLSVLLLVCFGCANARAQTAMIMLNQKYPEQMDRCSCQARFIAFALIHKNPILYPPDRLMEIENDIRIKIKEVANVGEQVCSDIITHEHWKKAVIDYTDGRFFLYDHQCDTKEEVIETIIKITGHTAIIGSNDIPINSNGIAGISVTKINDFKFPIGKDNTELYKGHVISVLAVDYEGKMIISNSWRKFDGQHISIESFPSIPAKIKIGRAHV